jgi:2-polyprenyl-3-methyl-5-hydroxy-6-metoxy-1,4-benzoquinol methylase
MHEHMAGEQMQNSADSHEPLWDHNVQFHEHLLSRCPAEAQCVLDIGCGHGLFASRLAERAATVDAIDADPSIVREAKKRVTAPNIRFLIANFLEAELPVAHYDMISAIASLHHMDAVKAIAKMKLLLRPGGVLTVLGLYRERTPADMAFAIASVPVDWFYRGWQWRRRSPPAAHVPMRAPQMTLAQVRATAEPLLPGVSVRRHLLWRYSLTWRKG